MKYQKGYKQIQREKAVRRLKRDLALVGGILVFLLVLGIVGKVTR